MERLQRSLESKLGTRLPTAGWTKPFLIWKSKITPARRRYCLLFVDKQAMKEKGFGLWHTPRTLMIIETPERFRARMNGARPKDRKEGLPNLAVQAIWVDQFQRGKVPPEIHVGSNAPTGFYDECHLNQKWICWLMGFPIIWHSNRPTETPSSRKSRKHLSKPS